MKTCDHCKEDFHAGKTLKGYGDFCDDCIEDLRSLKVSPKEFTEQYIESEACPEEIGATIKDIIEPLISGSGQEYYDHDYEEESRIKRLEHEGDLRRGVIQDSRL